MAEADNMAKTQERGKGRLEAWMRAAEKWGGHWKRAERLIKCLNNFEQEGLVGLTNMRAGPPNHLEADVKSMWKARVVEVIRECTADYWVPFMEKGIERDWKKLREFLLCNIQQCREDKTRSRGWEGSKATAKGIERIFKDRGEERKRRQEIPLPPAEVPPKKQLGMIIRNMEGWGVLKRGEERGPVNSRYDIDVAIGWKEDKAEIMGRVLYGCRGRDSFIYRSLVKYLDTYEKEKKFISRHIRMRQGRLRKINSFKQYREALCRRNFLLGKNELEIITRLYQVQIRIFKEARNNDSNMICIEQIGQEYDKVVNILSKQGRWALINSRGQERMLGIGRGKNKQEEADRVSNTDRHQKEQDEKTERRRGIQQGKEEVSRVGQENPRTGMENRKEEKKKETEGGSIERQDSIDKQVDNKEAREKEQEEVPQVDRKSIDRGREEEIGVRKHIESIEYDKIASKGEEEKSSIAEDSEDSPIELLDRGKLDRCLAEYVEDIRRKDREEEEEKSTNEDIEREKEGEKYRINNRQEERYRVNNTDRHYEEKQKTERRRIQQRKGERSRVEQGNLRIEIEDRQEDNKKEIEGGIIAWQDSIDKQVDIEEARVKEQEEVSQVDRIGIDRGKEILVRKDIESIDYSKVENRGEKSSIVEDAEDSPIELLDRGKLERWLAEYTEETRRKDREEQEENRDIDRHQEEREANSAVSGRMQQRCEEYKKREYRGVEYDILRIEIEEKQEGEGKGADSAELARQGSRGKQEGSDEDRVEEGRVVREKKNKEKATQEEKETIDREREEKLEDSRDRKSREHDKVEERGEGTKGDPEESSVELLDREKLDTYLAEYVERMHMTDREKERAEEKTPGEKKEDIKERKGRNNIRGKREEERQKERWRAGDSDMVSNSSLIELLDMRELDRWLANNIEKLRIERGEEKGEIGENRESDVEREDEGREVNQVGGKGRAR